MTVGVLTMLGGSDGGNCVDETEFANIFETLFGGHGNLNDDLDYVREQYGIMSHHNAGGVGWCLYDGGGKCRWCRPSFVQCHE